jgi:hypothetical protein
MRHNPPKSGNRFFQMQQTGAIDATPFVRDYIFEVGWRSCSFAAE